MTKEEKKEIVKQKCNEALLEIEKELKLEKRELIISGYDFTLTKSALINIESEIKMMLKVFDKRKYKPTYPRFLLDFPSTPIRDLLMFVNYIYDRDT